jgi:hypothetical protein
MSVQELAPKSEFRASKAHPSGRTRVRLQIEIEAFFNLFFVGHNFISIM